MAGKREKPEDIVLKLRKVEVLQGQGRSTAEAVWQIGVTVQINYRWHEEGPWPQWGRVRPSKPFPPQAVHRSCGANPALRYAEGLPHIGSASLDAAQGAHRPAGRSTAGTAKTTGDETRYRDSPLLSDENERNADLLVGLTDARKTWGFGLCARTSAEREGAPVEAQTRLSHLLRSGAEPADQTGRTVPDALAVSERPNITLSIAARQWTDRTRPSAASHLPRN